MTPVSLLLRSLGLIVTVYALTVFITWFSGYVLPTEDIYDLSDDTHTLIIGNSHLETSLDPSVRKGIVNRSVSGTGYFYSFAKIRQYLAVNPNLDTLVIPFAYDELYGSREKLVFGEKGMNFIMPKNYSDLEWADIQVLLENNRRLFITVLPKAASANLGKFLRRKNPGEGYHPHTKVDLKTISSYAKKPIIAFDGAFATVELNYLKKIYDLAQLSDIYLVFLGTPLHNNFRQHFSEYGTAMDSLHRNQFPEAVFYDDAAFSLPEGHFYDGDHLNKKGAALYSNFRLGTGLAQKRSE